MAADARLILLESTIFGRTAMGRERQGRAVSRFLAGAPGGPADLRRGKCGWRIPIAQTLTRGAVAGGAHGLRHLPDRHPPMPRSGWRRPAACLAEVPCPCGVSALDGFLVARFFSAMTRRPCAGALIRFVEAMRGQIMPRSWMI